MSKINVNVATRDELAEVAGLRPELAEAIVKLRDERGKLSNIEELDEVQGVGPATLEQLRQAFTFGPTAEEKAERQQAKAEEKAERERIEAEEKAERDRVEAEDKAKRERVKAERDHAKAEEKAERERIEAAQEAERVAKETAKKMAEAGRDVATAGAQAASNAARTGLQLVQRTAGSTVQVQRETMRKSAEGTAELGKLYTDLLKEQTQHTVQVAQAFGKVFNWNEAVQAQSEFIRASFERMNQLNSRYIEIVQAVMTSAVSGAKDQAKKAA